VEKPSFTILLKKTKPQQKVNKKPKQNKTKKISVLKRFREGLEMWLTWLRRHPTFAED